MVGQLGDGRADQRELGRPRGRALKVDPRAILQGPPVPSALACPRPYRTARLPMPLCAPLPAVSFPSPSLPPQSSLLLVPPFSRLCLTSARFATATARGRPHGRHHPRLAELHTRDQSTRVGGDGDQACGPADILLRPGRPADRSGDRHRHDQDDRRPQGFMIIGRWSE